MVAIIITAIVSMSIIEYVALQNGVNGYGLIAFFTGLGALLSWNIKGRVDKLAGSIKAFVESNNAKSKDKE